MKAAGWTTIAIECAGKLEQIPGRMRISEAQQAEARGSVEVRYVTEGGRREMRVRARKVAG